MNTKNIRFKDYEFDDFVFDDSFINYATNKNQSDVIKWEKWLSHNPGNKEIAEEAELLIRHLRFKNSELSSDSIKNEWLKLRNRLNISESSHPAKNKISIRRKLWRYAAAASFILFFVSAVYYFNSSHKYEKIANYHEIIVPKGEIKKILLPDGSVVFINSDSKLKYSNYFGEKKREVFLEGEASFDVKHNAKKPFIVHTEENDMIVLGTAFNVYAYPNENIFRASLERGKISVSYNNEDAVELEVNQTYLLIRNSKQLKIFETADIQSYSSWKEGKILIRNQKFTEILRRLERSHNVIFKLQNKEVGNCKFTGTFSTEDDINAIMGVIKLPTPFEYEILNRFYISFSFTNTFSFNCMSSEQMGHKRK